MPTKEDTEADPGSLLAPPSPAYPGLLSLGGGGVCVGIYVSANTLHVRMFQKGTWLCVGAEGTVAVSRGAGLAALGEGEDVAVDSRSLWGLGPHGCSQCGPGGGEVMTV